MLWVSCIEMTWSLIHIKYNRYTSRFIVLVHINLVVISTWQLRPMHICTLQVGRWSWSTNFAYYSCCIKMTLIVYVWISFLLVSADQIWVAIRVHISCIGIDLDNLPVELWRTGTWTHISVMVKHVLFTTVKLVSK